MIENISGAEELFWTNLYTNKSRAGFHKRVESGFLFLGGTFKNGKIFYRNQGG